MKGYMPYDCSEPDNIRAWKRLPPCFQNFIRTIQNCIEDEIQKKNPCKYRATSGFRAESVNRKYGGQLESGHRVGYPRDFVPVDGFSVNSHAPVVDVSRFRVLRSPADVKLPQKCWHIEFIC